MDPEEHRQYGRVIEDMFRREVGVNAVRTTLVT